MTSKTPYHIVIDARIISSTSGRYVERLVTYLQEVDTGNRYTVLVQPKDEDYWKPVSPNFTVMVADFDNYSFAEQLGYKRFLDRLAPDLVHFCMPQQPVLYQGKTVTTFHDMTLLRAYNSDKNWFIFHAKQLVGKWAFRQFARNSSHIIAITKYTKQDLLRFVTVPDEKISVIYEAGETTTGKSTPYSLPFSDYILYVGNQSDYKNIKRLCDAHQKLLQQHPDLGLVLAGKINPAAKKTQDYVNNKGYKNILFTDFVTDEELNWLYDNTQAYIFPSLMEGFGLPGLEAMAHNVPVVSSNATCLPEVYGDAAHYFDPLDVADMAQKIDEVLTSQSLRQKLITNGKKQQKKYSWKQMAEETHDVYMSVLTNSPEQS